jgi:HK97 family phage major capsid protein
MAREKSITEMKDELHTLQLEGLRTIEKARSEGRKLDKNEEALLTARSLEMQEISIQMEYKKALNRGIGVPQGGYGQGRNYSLRKALLNMIDRRGYDDATMEVNERAKNELVESGISFRGDGLYVPLSAEKRAGYTATGAAGTGSDLVDTDYMDILPALGDRLVLTQAGANMITGLRSNIDIPTYSGGTTNWELENDPAQESSGTFTHKKMSPKRLTAYMDISRQLLIQDTLAIETMLRNDLVNTIATNVQKAILDGHAADPIKPNSIFENAGVAAALSWAKIVDMETLVDTENALQGNISYIMHTALHGAAKKTPKVADSTAAWSFGMIVDDNGKLNGYDSYRTNSVAGDAENGYGIAFGNWNDLVIGQWGSIELIVDPYTRATEAFVRIIINSYWDACLRRDASITVAKLTV